MPVSERTYDAIVIGGGFAGVTAARDIADQGASVVLLEARDRLGGRTWSKKMRFADHEIVGELGGTWIDPEGHVYLRSELDRYGVGVELEAGWDSYPTLLNGQRLPGPLPVPPEQLWDLERAAYQIHDDVRRVTVGIPLDQQGLDDLDIPFSEYLDRLAVPAETRGWLTYTSSFGNGHYPHEVSALSAVMVVAMAYGTLLQFFAGGLPKIEGGTGVLIERIAADGLEVRLDTQVTHVSQTDDGVSVTTASGEVFTARAAVVALPMVCWGDVEFDPPLSPPKREASAERHVSAGVKVFAHVKNAPLRTLMIADAPTSSGAFATVTASDLGDSGQVIVGFMIREPDDPDSFDVSFEGVERFVKTMFPEAELVSYECHDWNTDQWSGHGGWTAYRPGRLTKSHSQLSHPEGRLFFATSDIAHHHFGFIDGAIEMGKKAAAEAHRLMLRELVGAKG